jgi:hypothetical protein
MTMMVDALAEYWLPTPTNACLHLSGVAAAGPVRQGSSSGRADSARGTGTDAERVVWTNRSDNDLLPVV